MKVITGDGKTIYLPGPGHVDWFADDNVPEGYLACDGSAVSRETYADLFAKIGTTFGTGNGSTTFNVPDLRGKFIRGYLSGTSGNFGEAQQDAMRQITGSISILDRVSGGGLTTANSVGALRASGFTTAATLQGAYTQTSDTGIAFNNSLVTYTADENRPVNVALLPCIKY